MVMLCLGVVWLTVRPHSHPSIHSFIKTPNDRCNNKNVLAGYVRSRPDPIILLAINTISWQCLNICLLFYALLHSSTKVLPFFGLGGGGGALKKLNWRRISDWLHGKYFVYIFLSFLLVFALMWCVKHLHRWFSKNPSVFLIYKNSNSSCLNEMGQPPHMVCYTPTTHTSNYNPRV